MSKAISLKLNTADINAAVKELKNYIVRLKAQCKEFVTELAEVGIETVKQYIQVEDNEVVVDRSDLVFFKKDIVDAGGEITYTMYVNANTYISEWVTKSGTKYAEVNPLLMAEFGSGAKAVDGHRGSFPNQVHAFDKDGWWWVDSSGLKHHSRGNAPTRPLLHAREEMERQIGAVAERVFKL